MLAPRKVQFEAKRKEKDANCLGLTSEAFMEQFLESQEQEGKYKTKHMPCDFLRENGECMQQTPIGNIRVQATETTMNKENTHWY